MTPSEIKAQYEFFVDDEEVSEDTIYVLMNTALNNMYALRPWDFLKTNDDTDSTVIGTSSYDLPSDFLFPLPVYIGTQQVEPIDRAKRMLYKEAFSRYYIDWKNGKYVLTYSPTTSDTIYFDYIYQPDQITTAYKDTDFETLVPGFKKAFHILLAYEMAKIYYYQDAGSKADSWANEWEVERIKLFNSMEDYDAQLKAVAQNSSIPYVGESKYHNVINID